MKYDQWKDELNLFADIDWDFESVELDDCWQAKFRRNSFDVTVDYYVASSAVVYKKEGKEERYNKHSGFLASPDFGNIHQIARTQRALLEKSPELNENEDSIPQISIMGDLQFFEGSDSSKPVIDLIDEWTVLESSENVRAVVIDGPAGIGKTHLIRLLLKRRAENYGSRPLKPLIIHVQSKGQKLTGLFELLAKTLQSMRLSLTYDQIPILIRHGLLQLAIDGFDELADPDGYDNAWNQVRDLISDVKSSGLILLAGRDTFIDRDSVCRSLPILQKESVASAHLRPPTSTEAKKWLEKNGISLDKIESLDNIGLLDEGAYSLRPFFLQQILKISQSGDGIDSLARFPLDTLISAMIKREIPLMRKLAPNLTDEKFIELLENFLQEVAQEMADTESDSLDVESLQLFVDLVFSDHTSEENIRSIRHRVQSIALLEADLGHNSALRCFVHSEVQFYFLAKGYVRRLLEEVHKFSNLRSLKRNILSSDVLDVFHDVVQSLPFEDRKIIFDKGITFLKQRRSYDRSPGNIAALLLASLGNEKEDESMFEIEDIVHDEFIFRGVVPAIKLKRCKISRFDVRGANLRKVVFDDCEILSLVIDDSVLLPYFIPKPTYLVIDGDGKEETIRQPVEIQSRIESRMPEAEYNDIEKNKMLCLLEKICRIVIRQTWIKNDVDDDFGKILDVPEWPDLREILDKYQLLDARSMPAGGRRSEFIRIKRANEILAIGVDKVASDVLKLKHELAVFKD